MRISAEQLKEWSKEGREFLTGNGAPASVNAERRTVDVVWFTSVDVGRVDPWTGDSYILRFDPAGADLSLLNNGAPVLDDHSRSGGAAGQMGKVEKAWREGRKFSASLRFSRRTAVAGLWMDIQDGIVSKFSMGVEILEASEDRNAAGRLALKTATNWRPFELSVTPIPADFDTTTLGKTTGSETSAAVTVDALRRQRELEILQLR